MNRPVMTGTQTWASVLLALAAMTFSPAMAGEIYKWVDENGVIHFGDRPPQREPDALQTLQPELESSGVGPGIASDFGLEVNEDGQTVAQQRREEIRDSRREARLDQEERQNLCDYHQKQLARYEPARRLTYTNESGEVVRLDDDQRLALIENSKKIIEQNCK